MQSGVDDMGEDYSIRIAETGLKIGAIKLRPEDPFTWASGYRMPIYNDNRMFLGDFDHRFMIREAFVDLIQDQGDNIVFDIVAGTSTAGISPATTLGDFLMLPVIYVRDKPKDHGLRNQIEGIDAEKDLEGAIVGLVEDLISTGGSSARAVQAIRDANGICNVCISIFDYGLDKGEEAFRKLNPACEKYSLLTYDKLLAVAENMGYLNRNQTEMLEEWRADPFGWGEKHGFPKINR